MDWGTDDESVMPDTNIHQQMRFNTSISQIHPHYSHCSAVSTAVHPWWLTIAPRIVQAARQQIRVGVIDNHQRQPSSSIERKREGTDEYSTNISGSSSSEQSMRLASSFSSSHYAHIHFRSLSQIDISAYNHHRSIYSHHHLENGYRTQTTDVINGSAR